MSSPTVESAVPSDSKVQDSGSAASADKLRTEGYDRTARPDKNPADKPIDHLGFPSADQFQMTPGNVGADKPAPTKPVIEQTAKDIHAAIHDGNFRSTNGRVQQVQLLLESLSSTDRKLVEKIYAERYGNGGNGTLRNELQHSFSDANFRSIEAVLNRAGDKTNDAGALKAAVTLTKDDPERGSARVRAVLGMLRSDQLEELDKDYRKAYGKGFRQELGETKELTESTRRALPHLINGIDKVSADDKLAAARIAIETKDARLFAESVRGESKEAAEARTRLLNDSSTIDSLWRAFPTTFKNPVELLSKPPEQRVDPAMLDYLKEGKISLKTIVQANTPYWINLLDNPENVELAVRNATPDERRLYTLGRTLGINERTAATGEEQQALQYYRSLHSAFEKGGKSRQVAIWEDQLINGRETISSQLAKASGFWDHTTRDLMTITENISKEDWEILRKGKTGDPQGQNFRAQILSSIKTFATAEEQTRIMELLDAKASMYSFKESQGVKRDWSSIEKDSARTILGIGVGTDTASLLKSIETMSGYQAYLYRMIPSHREQINKAVEEKLSGDENAYAWRLLLQVMNTGHPPQLGPIEKFMSSAISKDSPETKIRNAEEALKDEALRKRLSKPDKELTTEDRQLKSVMTNVVRDALLAAGRKPLTEGAPFEKIRHDFFEKGQLPTTLKARMEFPLKDILPKLSSLSKPEQQHVLERLDAEHRQVAEAVLKNNGGSPSLGDRMRVAAIDGDKAVDFKPELFKMSAEQKAALKDEYARKYQVTLENDFLRKVDGQDQKEYKELLAADKTSTRQRYYDSYSEMLKSESGFSPDGSKWTLERANDFYATAMQKYEAIKATMPAEKREALDKFFDGSLQQYKESKEKLAELAIDMVVTAAALAAAPFTSGASMTMVMSVAAASGAALRVGMKSAIQGNDFDWSASNVLREGAQGATGTAMNFVAFNSASAVTRFMNTVGRNVSADVIKTAGAGVLKEGAEAQIAKETSQLLARKSIRDIKNADIDAIISAVVSPAASVESRTALRSTVQDSIFKHHDPLQKVLAMEAAQKAQGFGRELVKNMASGAGSNIASDVVAGQLSPNGTNVEGLKVSATIGAAIGALIPGGRALGRHIHEKIQPVAPVHVKPLAAQPGGIRVEEVTYADGNIYKREVYPSGSTFLTDKAGLRIEYRSVSPEFQEKVRQSIAKLPDADRKFLAGQSDVRVDQWLTDIWPNLKNQTPRGYREGSNWDSVRGLYYPHPNELAGSIAISERSTRGKTTQTDSIIAHETGHAIARARAKDDLSGLFSEAYFRDYQAMTPDQRKKFPHLFQERNGGPTEGGLKETYAEVYAAMEGKSAYKPSEVLQAFPHVRELLRQHLRTNDGVIPSVRPNQEKLPDGTIVTRDRQTVEMLHPGGNTTVSILDDKRTAQMFAIDQGRFYTSPSGERFRYMSNDELGMHYEMSSRQRPDKIGALPDSQNPDFPGLLSAHKAPYEVEMQQVLADQHPLGLRLSTREDRMTTTKELTLRTADGGTVKIAAQQQLPVGMQIDIQSGTLITPREGVRLPSGQVVNTQKVDFANIAGGQHLKAGNKETGYWLVIRRTQDDQGYPIFDAYHLDNARKEKNWNHQDGNTYRSKTGDARSFVLAPSIPTVMVPSYGGLAHNKGPGVLVKEGNLGYYFIGIEELKETHIGDARTQQIINRTWAEYRAQKTGGVWSPSRPTEYAIPHMGGWRVIRADGTVAFQRLSWAE